MRPARAREQNRVSVARAAAKGAGAASDACLSEPPPGRSAAGDGRASGPGVRARDGSVPLERQKIDHLVEAAPATRCGGEGREL